ncbi:S41 family peptidase [Vallitalea okinawensis]|uniref:S41 family peptidase n=1 Tax=Vallitalea okinawensis TaxID=2078660 RepID=UPI000CFC537A|nr:S41 family peptidase [Vallitalea okinawensis]
MRGKKKLIIFLSSVLIIAILVLLFITLAMDRGYGINQREAVYLNHLEEDISSLSKQEQFIIDFDFLYKELKENYILFDYKQEALELNLEDEYQKYKEQVVNAVNDRQFYRICLQFIGLFKDGHMNFNTSNYDTRYAIRSKINTDYTQLFDYKVIEGRPIIIAAQKSFDIVGWEIISLNGIPFTEVESNIKKVMNPQSQINGEILSYFSLFYETIPDQVDILLKNKEGAQKTVTIDFQKKYTIDKEKGSENINFGYYHENDLPSYNILDKNIGYILIPSFATSPKDIIRQFEKIVLKLEEADVNGVIIDLRYNGGGNESFRDILGYLTDNEIDICNFRYKKTERFMDIYYFRTIAESQRHTKSRDAEEGYSPWWTWRILPNDNQYLNTLPVVILSNEYTYSSSDSFISACLEYDLGTVISNRVVLSGGGLPTTVSLPSKNYQVSYGMWEGWSSDFSYQTEGKVMEPDLLAFQSLDDYYKDIDTFVEKALEILK